MDDKVVGEEQKDEEPCDTAKQVEPNVIDTVPVETPEDMKKTNQPHSVDDKVVGEVQKAEEPCDMANQVEPNVIDTVPVETTEDINKNVETKTDSGENKLKRTEPEPKHQTEDNTVIVNPLLLSPPLKPTTPPPQLPKKHLPACELLDISQQYKNNLSAMKTKSCTVGLEILTEADIVKHVHVHREAASKASVTTVETVENQKLLL